MQIVTSDLKEKHPGTIINFVIDMSGSMSSCCDATIDAFNKYVEEHQKSKLAERKGQIYLTLTVFDTEFIVVYACKEISEVPKLTNEVYCPRDMTALNDAVGFTICAVEDAIKDWTEKPKILTVVLTDGGENSSQEFSTEKIQQLIKDKEAQGWTFIFLAEGIKNAEQGLSMGISARNIRSFNTADMGETMDALCCSSIQFCDSIESEATPAHFFDLSSEASEKWNKISTKIEEDKNVSQ